MNRLICFAFFIICFATLLYASNYSTNLRHYNNAKKNYAKIISYNNKTKEIKYLKQLIYYGTKLKKNVYKYKRELKWLRRTSKFPKYSKTLISKRTVKRKSKYSIKNIYQKNNQIIIAFNKKISKKDIRYFTRKSTREYQYIFDIKGRFKKTHTAKLSLHNVDRIKIVQYRFNTARITLTNKSRLKLVYIVQNKRIIIKNITHNKEEKVKYFKYIDKRKTIVIDPGHGGKDAGAISPRRKYEKTVVLNIGKYLYRELKKRNYKVFLTRNKDKFISLRRRTKMANKKNADIFISIHANATKKNMTRQARGIETYFLSPARSKRAKMVAEQENMGDINIMNWNSRNTFLTILNQSKITASNKLAIDIQKNMLYSLRQKYGKWAIKDGGVREGPFWVLVGAQMPSILIEVGYISHPIEGKRIYTKTYQKLIAIAIANGIDSYFTKN